MTACVKGAFFKITPRNPLFFEDNDPYSPGFCGIFSAFHGFLKDISVSRKRRKKTAPGIPRTVLSIPAEPVRALFDGEAVGSLAEFLKFLGGALQPRGEGKAEIQTEHLHEALAVDPVTDIAHVNRIRLGGSQSDKLLYRLY